MTNNFPHHIAIIPDGNRRWAKQHNLPNLEGHRRGANKATELARKIRAMGISTLTFWAFSTENWSRSEEEITYLVKLGMGFFDQLAKDAMKDEVRVVHLGRSDRLPKELMDKIAAIEEKTKHFTKFFLNIALDYGGRDEILRAVKKITAAGKNLKDLTEESFLQYLDTKDEPYPLPDIVIRTSGEQRTSGFMLWQAAYAEYFYPDKYFPDLSAADIENIVDEFMHRQRRFGR